MGGVLVNRTDAFNEISDGSSHILAPQNNCSHVLSKCKSFPNCKLWHVTQFFNYWKETLDAFKT